jgi:hypothetical protein
VNKKAQMSQNLYTGNFFLCNSAKYRVFYLQMAPIFQQCTNCFEKQDLLTALGLDKESPQKLKLFIFL